MKGASGQWVLHITMALELNGIRPGARIENGKEQAMG
jgi:hypothetical protein